MSADVTQQVVLTGGDLEASLVTSTTNLRATLERLSGAPHLFLVVVDGDGRLVGTVTDGDLRRAFLAGFSMDSPIVNAMQRDPIRLVRSSMADLNKAFARVRSVVRFLPVVDAAGKLIEIIVERQRREPLIAALIMAGGRGKRLGDATQRVPKPMITVRGLPMIEHVVRAIEAADVRRVFVSAHYLAEQIQAWAKGRGGAVEVEVINETTPLGTAGALGLLPEGLVDDVMVMNADVITGVDLTHLLQFHLQLRTEATVAVVTHETEIPFGVVRADRDGRFLGIEEKPRLAHLVAAGIYVLSPSARAFVEPGVPIDMPQLLARIRAGGLPVGVFPIQERWRDLGRPGDIDAENARLVGSEGHRT